MKHLIILLVFAFCSCIPKAENHNRLLEPNFDYLIGSWIRTNEKPDRNTFESWTKTSPSEYKGSGLTVKDKDTIWQEDVILSKIETDWNLTVTDRREKNQVVFKLTEISKDGFTCENQENEFPKIIRYKIVGQILFAEIEGGDMKIPFEFKKVK